MSCLQQNIENLSRKLSEVLSDIGINDEMILKRRTHTLLREASFNVLSAIGEDGSETYLFGSQSEGSTTIGLQSDTDTLVCNNSYYVVPDWSDWNYGVKNVLMVQDETTAAGYCLLQLLSNAAPVAANYVPNNMYNLDTKQRVVLKNSVFDGVFRRLGIERHGPAGNEPGNDHITEVDYVIALRCTQWPHEGRRWLNRRSRSGWPSAQLKSECERSGCFLVPVGSKISGLDELEWRISTSTAERYLMFSLNVTQMRCYVLIKILLKSYHVFHDVISSYMCKTALFHCIENTNRDFWQERNLLLCLNQILRVLYNCIYYFNCPHFIIPENNLMAERISADQRRALLSVLQDIIKSNGTVYFQLQLDDIGVRFREKFKRVQVLPRHIRSAVETRKFISASLCYNLANYIICQHRHRVQENNTSNHQALLTFSCYYDRCNQQYQNFSCLEQRVCTYYEPFLCSTIGSLLASYYTALNIPLSESVMSLLMVGVNSDVSSGWLKLATVYYSVGEINVTESILRHVEQLYDRIVVLSVCSCKVTGLCGTKEFGTAADLIQGTDFRHIVSYCVIFMRCELNIIPLEMRQESFRSMPGDMQCRGILDKWMDLAVVDSLPYLYFLQYKTFGRLGNRGEKVRALYKLQQVIHDDPNLGHRETALNLLGQCMEQENLPIDALLCYERSLQIRPRNNAANFHMSRLLHR